MQSSNNVRNGLINHIIYFMSHRDVDDDTYIAARDSNETARQMTTSIISPKLWQSFPSNLVSSIDSMSIVDDSIVVQVRVCGETLRLLQLNRSSHWFGLSFNG